MSSNNSAGAGGKHPIQVVARRSGLTADVLRAWEKRYGVVQPTRSPGGRRLYSNGDIDRLILLREATDAGRRIGDVAGLATTELEEMVREDREARATAPSRRGILAEPYPPSEILDRALEAVRALDGPGLAAELRRAVVLLPPTVLVAEVIAPLMERIGEMWWAGEVSVGHEHLASAVVMRTLARMAESLEEGGDGPRIVVATPSGQRHEIGARLVAAAAAAYGWSVFYLGPDLPADDIVAAAHRIGVSAVALSIIHPADDPALGDELRRLRRRLDGSIAILAGGRAARGYRDALDEIGAELLPDIDGLRTTLETLAGGASQRSVKRSD